MLLYQPCRGCTTPIPIIQGYDAMGYTIAEDNDDALVRVQLDLHKTGQ